jgi:hypothetical protein
MSKKNPDLKKGEEIVKKYEQYKSARANWDEHWEDLAEYFIPNKDDVYGYRMDGEKKFNRLYDSTSIQSLEMLSSSLHGMLTNPASVWFGLSTGDSKLDMEKDVQVYLQECTRITIDALNQSNFQEEIHETYQDLGGIGTTVLDIEEDDEHDVRFRSGPIYSSYIAENHKGIVDTLYRCWPMSLRNIVSKFGEDILAEESFKSAHDKDPEQKEEVIYAIYPHSDEKQRKLGKFEASFVIRKYMKVLEERTYHSWPHAVPRWTKLNQEVYGRAPSMKCLPDVKMLNAVMKTTIRGMQKVVDPPLMIPDNGFLLPINTTPGGSNFYRAGIKDRIEPFPVTARPDVGLDFIENIRGRIREAFYWDQMQLINQRDMTATEVMQRTDERLRFLGPVLGRLNNELLRPIIDRVFDILSRRGRYPKPPGILKNKPNLKVVYTSQIAKAQRTGEANTLLKVLQAAQPIIMAQPDTMDNFNGDDIIRYYSNLFGLPHEFVNDQKAVKATREGRAQAQQKAAQAQMENQNADTQLKQAKAQTA